MTYRPTIRTQHDLLEAWRYLMSPLGFSGRSTWFMFIDSDGHPVPQVTQVEEGDEPPTPDDLAGLVAVVAELCEELVPGGRVAFLRSRPGTSTLTTADRTFARGLYDAGRRSGLPVEVVHLACDTDVVALPLDDALPGTAA